MQRLWVYPGNVAVQSINYTVIVPDNENFIMNQSVTLCLYIQLDGIYQKLAPSLK